MTRRDKDVRAGILAHKHMRRQTSFLVCLAIVFSLGLAIIPAGAEVPSRPKGSIITRWQSWLSRPASTSSEKSTGQTSSSKKTASKTAKRPSSAAKLAQTMGKKPPQATTSATAFKTEGSAISPSGSEAGPAGLELDFTRDNLVFETGERFVFSVIPRNISVSGTQTVRCRVALLKARTDTELWSAERDGMLANDGKSHAIGPFSVPLPGQEGPYELLVALHSIPTAGQSEVHPVWPDRRIDLVVVAPSHPTRVAGKNVDANLAQEWRLVQQFDLADLKLSATDDEVTPVNLDDRSRILGKGTVQSVPFQNQKINELGPQATRVVPLNISDPNRPVLLEVDYPANIPQKLSLAIMEDGEAHAAGLVVDRGFVVETGERPATGLQTHRSVYWPTTKTPWLVIANPSDIAVRCGQIRVRSGGLRLPPSEPAPSYEERLTAIQIEDPSFIDAFSAGVTLDRELTPIADWTAWYQTGDYLTQYLRYEGYNGASFPIVHTGGALYPSDYVPSFVDPERGTTTTQATDPRAKDVVEMLLRQFARHNLRSVPALYLSCGIRELDELADKGEVGIYLTSSPGSENNIAGPRYNPLNAHVQEVVRKIVAEIVARFGHHESFAGLSIPMLPDTCTHLPAGDWGTDAITFAHFMRDEKIAKTDIANPGQPATLFREQPELYRRWLTWRCRQLAKFYNQLAGELAKSPAPVKLYLSLPESAKLPGSDVQRSLRECGLDPLLLEQQDRIVVSTPQRLIATDPNRLESLGRSGDAAGDAVNAAAINFAAAFVLREPQEVSVPLPSLVGKSDGSDEVVRFSGQASAGLARVRAAWLRTIMRGDPVAVFDGGKLPPFGQETALRDIFAIWRKLPAKAFTAVPAASPEFAEPVVVRSLHEGDKCYAYLVNPTRWTCRVTLSFDAGENFRLERLLGGATPPPLREDGRTNWSIDLPAHDIIAVVAHDSPGVVRDYHAEFADEAYRQVAATIQLLRQKSNSQGTIVVENNSFEAPLERDNIPGWNLQEGPRTTAELAATGRTGTKSLRLTSLHPAGGFSVVASSQPFAVKKMTRFSAGVWIRNNDELGTPVVRLILDAKTPHGAEVRTADFGTDPRALRPLPPLKSEWTWCPIDFDKLPADTSELVFQVVLRKNGDISLDDVECRDFWLSADEQSQLRTVLTTADKHLSQKKVAAAAKCLETELVANILKQTNSDGRPTQSLTQPSPITISPSPTIVGVPDLSLPANPADPPTVSANPSAEFERLPPVEESPLILQSDELPLTNPGNNVPSLPKVGVLPPPLPSLKWNREPESKAEKTATKPNSPPATNWFQRLISPAPANSKSSSMFR